MFCLYSFNSLIALSIAMPIVVGCGWSISAPLRHSLYCVRMSIVFSLVIVSVCMVSVGNNCNYPSNPCRSGCVSVVGTCCSRRRVSWLEVKFSLCNTSTCKSCQYTSTASIPPIKLKRDVGTIGVNLNHF